MVGNMDDSQIDFGDVCLQLVEKIYLKICKAVVNELIKHENLLFMLAL